MCLKIQCDETSWKFLGTKYDLSGHFEHQECTTTVSTSSSINHGSIIHRCFFLKEIIHRCLSGHFEHQECWFQVTKPADVLKTGTSLNAFKLIPPSIDHCLLICSHVSSAQFWSWYIWSWGSLWSSRSILIEVFKLAQVYRVTYYYYYSPQLVCSNRDRTSAMRPVIRQSQLPPLGLRAAHA